MTSLNDLDPARLLDLAGRANAGGERQKRYLFFVSDRGRGLSLMRDLAELGWTVRRAELEAALPGVVVQFVSVGAADHGTSKVRGRAISGYAVDEDIALHGSMRLSVLLPAMLGNLTAKETA